MGLEKEEEEFGTHPAKAYEAPAPKPTEASPTSAYIALVIGMYFFVSLSLVFINKILMAPEFFPYPMVITWLQFVIAFVCLVFGGLLKDKHPLFRLAPDLEFDFSVVKQVMPVTALYVLMIAANNICLQYVEVSFYQVARSLTILFTMFFTYVWLKKSTSTAAQVTCLVIVTGFVLGSKGEINFSYLGVFFGVLSSMFVSLYGISVKNAQKLLNDDIWRLLWYNTIISIVFMIPLLLISDELGPIFRGTALSNPNVIFMNLLGGLFGFAINIVVFLQIKVTSPLTNNIAGTVKASLQTILALIIFQNPITAMNALGIVLVIGGSSMYSYVRYLEMEKK